MFSKIVFMLVSIFLLNQAAYGQILYNYGLKGGVTLSGISSTNESIITTNNSFFVNFLSYDFGIYAELLNSKKFCVSAEVHYIARGNDNPNFNKIIYVEQSNGENIFKSKFLNDRFQYISFQVLPKYRFVITPSGENLYVFGGPRIEFLTGNSNSGGFTNTMDLKSFRTDFGATLGLGAELINFLILEFRFEHNFRGPYTFSYGDKTASLLHNSFSFLTGIAINKIF